MAEYHGGQMVVKSLEREGVGQVFSINGGHISHISDALLDSDVALYDTRHEQAAVMMAEAVARVSGRAGVAVVTAGPGFTNALTGVADANLAGVPLLLIAGVAPLNMVGRLDLQEMEQLSVVRPMVKWSQRVENPRRIPAVIHEAMLHARSGRPGPVYVEIPADVLGASVDEKWIEWGRPLQPSAPAADPGGVEAAAALLRSSERPVLIAGSGVWWGQAMAELKGFVEDTGIPCFTTALGRGCLPDTHPLCYGPALAIRPGAALFALTRSDCILLLGTRLSLFLAQGKLFHAEARLIHVNLDPQECQRNRPADLAIIADAGRTLRQLQAELAGTLSPDRFAPWRRELDAAHAQSLAAFAGQRDSVAVPIHPARLMREINDFLSADDLLVGDGGDTVIWMNMVRTNHGPGRTLDSGLFGCLGVGLPFALAAKIAAPERRVFAVVGDGSVGFNFMEFHTAVRFGLPLVVIINNDQAWGMTRHSQQLRFGKERTPGSDLGYVPYHKLVEALGGHGEEVREPHQIRPALQRAVAAGTVACINVLVERDVISPGSFALAAIGKNEISLETFGKAGGAY